SATRDLRKVVDRERSGRDLRGLAQGIVDVELDRAWRARLAGDRRDGLRDVARRKREVGAPLDAAEVHRAAPRAGTRGAVAKPQARVSLRIVARKGRLEPAPARRIRGARVAGDVADHRSVRQDAGAP